MYRASSSTTARFSADARRLLPAAVCLLLAAAATAAQVAPRRMPPPAPPRITVELNPTLFATMCALSAAGFEANIAETGFHPVRARMRALMLRQSGPATEALRLFYLQHRSADPAQTLSRYISFAVVAGPPPKFPFTVSRDELPQDVLLLEGFNDVLAAFYQEADLAKHWEWARAQYERELDRLQQPMNQIVLHTSAYLREILEPDLPRRFVVYIEPMVGGKTNLRNYGDLYALVLNPRATLPLDDIRHAFLHFLLDPLPGKYQAVVHAKQGLLRYAARAPRLPVEYKDDFPGFFAECLIRAAELRMNPKKNSAVSAEPELREADLDGFVLVRPLFRELAEFEQAQPAMTHYFPDLVRGVSLADEAARLENFQFAPLRPKPEATAEETPASVRASQIELWLKAAELQIAQKDAAGALATFAKVLQAEPDNLRALYGSGVAYALQGNAEKAKEVFTRLVVVPAGQSGAGPIAKSDPYIRAWSHVYLGRLHDVEGNRELALSDYRAALAVEGAPETARIAARSGLEKRFGAAAVKPGQETPRP